MRRSSNTVDEPATKLAVWWGGTAPHPGMGAPIELRGGDARGERNLGAIGKALASVSRPPQEPPPPLDEVEPTGGNRNEDLTHPGMRGQPVADGPAGVAGEIVGNQVQLALRGVAVTGSQEVQIARGSARRGGLGEDLPVTDAQRPLDPGFVLPTAVDKCRRAAL